MLASESQEKMVKEYLDYQVDDPLSYVEFKYPLNEWDNVPPIIPRFVLRMNQHLKAIVHKCKEKFNEETTKDLRIDFEARNKQLGVRIETIVDEQEDENNRTRQDIHKLQADLLDLKNNFEKFLNQFKTMADDDLPSFLRNTHTPKEKLKQARSYSISQLQDFFDYCLRNSKLQKDFDKEHNFGQTQNLRIGDLEDKKRQLNKRIDMSIKERNQIIENIRKFIQQVKKDNESRAKTINADIKTNQEKIKELNQFRDSSRTFEENIIIQLEKMTIKLEHNKSHINKCIKQLNNQMNDEIEKAGNEFRKLNDETFNEMTELADTNSANIDKLNRRLNIEWKNSEQEFENKIKAFSKDCTKKIEDVKMKTNKARDKIKDICTDYFTKHEENVIEIKTKVNSVIQSFEDWKMYVMNPQSINEARIHSLDVKCDDIEKQVSSNFTVIYTIVKKLLFSLQQQAVAPKDHSSLLASLNDPNQTQETQNFHGISMDKRSETEMSPKSKKNSDLMFLKRIFNLQGQLNKIAEGKRKSTEIRSAERSFNKSAVGVPVKIPQLNQSFFTNHTKYTIDSGESVRKTRSRRKQNQSIPGPKKESRLTKTNFEPFLKSKELTRPIESRFDTPESTYPPIKEDSTERRLNAQKVVKKEPLKKITRNMLEKLNDSLHQNTSTYTNSFTNRSIKDDIVLPESQKVVSNIPQITKMLDSNKYITDLDREKMKKENEVISPNNVYKSVFKAMNSSIQ
ncbi:unnamed protein product [Moneuplotes crassus]|uniref:Uncharacterized protein n=1 Tax=Euplotes crassus TaxID=5936 RepID=A0AAD1Y5X4_EUPCR|nr:unnamed protein product [Moneuplotes crassus]